MTELAVSAMAAEHLRAGTQWRIVALVITSATMRHQQCHSKR